MKNFVTKFRTLRTEKCPAEIYIEVYGSAVTSEEAAANAMREIARAMNADDLQWISTRIDNSDTL